MKKISLLLTAIVILFTSCSSGGIILDSVFGGCNSSENFVIGDDRSIANTQFEKVLEIINKRDDVAMKALLSSQIVNESADLDASIRVLFDFFEGEVVSYDDWGGPGVYVGKNDDGTGRNWKKIQSTYDVETSKQRYRFAIEEFTFDTANPDNVGIYSLYIIKAEDSNLQFAFRGDGKWTPGINIMQSKDK